MQWHKKCFGVKILASTYFLKDQELKGRRVTLKCLMNFMVYKRGMTSLLSNSVFILEALPVVVMTLL